MSIITYQSVPNKFSWSSINPLYIVRDLAKHRELAVLLTMQSFRATYKASYLGIAWQVILPLIMLFLFYFVFGVILGGKFSPGAVEHPVDYALALFVGLSFFNFIAQNIGTAPSLILSNQMYVKNISFPLELISLTSVLNVLLTLIINLLIVVMTLLIVKHTLPATAVCVIFYLICAFMIALGLSWAFSALAVFFRDISALTSPLTLILMFMCPIFYPASMVPHRIKWIISINPIAVIIENARGSLLFGVWPSLQSVILVFLVSLFIATMGHVIFIRTKHEFADSV